MAFFGVFGPVFTENVRIEWAEDKAVVRRRERRTECMSWTAGVDYSEDFSRANHFRGSKRATFPGRNTRRPVLFDTFRLLASVALLLSLS